MKRLTIRQCLLAVGALAVVTACSTAPPQVQPVSAPVTSRDAEAGARALLQAACEVTDRSVGACTLTLVPAGYRLVIETVTGRLGRFRSGETLAGPALQTTLSGVAQRHWLAREFVGTNATLNLDVYMVTHHLRLYADPGTLVVVETPDALGSFTISGYFVKLP